MDQTSSLLQHPVTINSINMKQDGEWVGTPADWVANSLAMFDRMPLRVTFSLDSLPEGSSLEVLREIVVQLSEISRSRRNVITADQALECVVKVTQLGLGITSSDDGQLSSAVQTVSNTDLRYDGGFESVIDQIKQVSAIELVEPVSPVDGEEQEPLATLRSLAIHFISQHDPEQPVSTEQGLKVIGDLARSLIDPTSDSENSVGQAIRAVSKTALSVARQLVPPDLERVAWGDCKIQELTNDIVYINDGTAPHDMALLFGMLQKDYPEVANILKRALRSQILRAYHGLDFPAVERGLYPRDLNDNRNLIRLTNDAENAPGLGLHEPFPVIVQELLLANSQKVQDSIRSGGNPLDGIVESFNLGIDVEQILHDARSRGR